MIDTILGVGYRDRVTGFKGVCMGKVQYLSGCNQSLISPPCREDGSWVDSQWFDDQRLVNADFIPRIVLDNSKTPGFDTQAPKR